MSDGEPANEAQTLRIRLLGGFRVSVGSRVVEDPEWRLRKAKSLVKLLTLASDHRLHREQVMDLLWPELDPDAAANNLHKILHIARRALEPNLAPGSPSAYLRLQKDWLVLQCSGTPWIDAEAFEAAAAVARRTRDPADYRSALELYTGDLLPEDRYEEWAATRRDALRLEYLALLGELARLHEARGEYGLAIEALRRIVADDPAHEEAQTALMRLYALAGQRHQALRQYEQLREALRRELDTEPHVTSQRLYHDIVAGRFPATPPAMPALLHGDLPSAPLVGRDEELEALEDILDALFSGQGRFVLLAGEAGVGKSRLAAEIAERVRRRGGHVLVGASYEQEGQVPYGPFVEALGRVATSLGPTDLRGMLGAAALPLFSLAPGAAVALAWDAPPALAGPPDRQRLFAAIADFLARLAAQAPVLFVLDDLHFADEATLQLLHYLVRTGRDKPLLFLGTFRPEEAGPADPLRQLVATLRRERLVTPFELRRLDARESELLVATLLGSDPIDRAVFETIYGLAEGNPFYTEEAVQALRERGQLERVDGRWRLRSEVAAVPGPLADLLAARLERLRPNARQVLRLAAVVGREIPYTLLRATSDLSEQDLLDALDECLARRVLEESTDGYRFTHPLQRTAIYDGLSRARRAHLHGSVAKALERLYHSQLAEHAETLAHHYSLSDVPGRAVPHLVTAGDRAASVYANETAMSYYRRALELLSAAGAPASPSVPAADLWEKIGDLWALIGEAGQDVAAYRMAVAIMEKAAEPAVCARLHRKAAYACLSQHDSAGAERHLGAAEMLLSDRPDPAEQGRLARVRAQWFWEHGRHAEALETAQASLELAERYGAPADVAAAYETMALVFHSCGEWKRGLHYEIQHLGAAADQPQLASVFDVHH